MAIYNYPTTYETYQIIPDDQVDLPHHYSECVNCNSLSFYKNDRTMITHKLDCPKLVSMLDKKELNRLKKRKVFSVTIVIPTGEE